MINDSVHPIDLSLSEDEIDLLKNDLKLKKRIGQSIKEARLEAKRDSCYYCGKKVTSFCNSHSIPRFCLANIAEKGGVETLNSILKNPLIDTTTGVNKAGTFRLICNECDNKIFSDYENPSNYEATPTPAMIAQIALKNCMHSISKRQVETQLNNKSTEEFPFFKVMCQMKNKVNEIDLKEYSDSYKKAKKAIESSSETSYYVCYYEKLNYVVPIAFQNSIALILDFDGNIINNIHEYNPKYRIQYIHLCIFPLKTETAIIMFIEDGDTRYRNFYKKFKKMPLEDKLATLTLIMFLYSEDVYFSKSIINEILDNEILSEAARTGSDVVSSVLNFNTLELYKKRYSLDKRNEIPNLLSEQYKIA